MPTALKILRGNPGQRKLNQHEAKPPQGAAEQPKILSSGAKLVWDRLAPICQHMGTLTSADAVAFARLCELEATAEETSRQKDAPGFAIFSESGVSSVIRLERETAIALRSYYEFFGLTPSSRSRLIVPTKAPEAPVSKWSGLA